MADLIRFEGVIASTITPSRGHENAIPSYMEFLRGRGVRGYYVLGTWGEGPRHGVEHRKRVAEKFVGNLETSEVAIVHVGASDMETVKELLRHANDIGATAAAAVAPFYYRPDEETLFRFYAELSERSSIPVVLYNIPSRQGYSLGFRIVSRVLGELGNVKGIKDSSGDPALALELVSEFRDKRFIAIGSDELIAYGFLIGANATVSGVAGVFPEVVVGVYRSIREGRIEEGFRYQRLVNRASSLLEGLGVEFETQRSALRIRGIDLGPPPEPVRQLTGDELDRLKKGIEEVLVQIKTTDGLEMRS
ncbi:MAG: dihydrodipicolinate synthase family protein [Nitrososphaerota archaeon]